MFTSVRNRAFVGNLFFLSEFEETSEIDVSAQGEQKKNLIVNTDV